MDLNLQGKSFIITGGTDGLGLATATRLLEEGAHVTVCGRNADRLAAAEKHLAAVSPNYQVVRADVTDEADLNQLLEAALDRWGQLDGIMNNAGNSNGGPVEELGGESLRGDFELKVFSAVRLTQLALPHLRKTQGVILNGLSIAARAARGASLPSSASRAAGLAMTKSLAHELAPDGIRVNALLVGVLVTGQWRRSAAAAGQEVEPFVTQAAEAMGIPLGRLGRPDEYADVAAFMLSSRSSYVTGAAINVDGGLSPVP